MINMGGGTSSARTNWNLPPAKSHIRAIEMPPIRYSMNAATGELTCRKISGCSSSSLSSCWRAFARLVCQKPNNV